jgi:hypothetical protein
MRRLVGALLFFLSFTAQATTTPLGFSAGPIFKLNGMGDGLLATLGGRINGSYGYFLFGLGGYGAVAQSKIVLGKKGENVSYSYGGLGLGVRFFPQSFIHITNYNTFGLGKLDLKNQGQSGLAYSIEPELNLEIDIFSTLRIGTGLSYRFLFCQQVPPPTKELSGLGWQFYVELGRI